MPPTQEERDEMAQKLFQKNFDECDAYERVKIGGHLGGGRIKEMAGKVDNAAHKEVGGEQEEQGRGEEAEGEEVEGEEVEGEEVEGEEGGERAS